MNLIEDTRTDTELQRIRAEYARREREIPSGFYSLSRSANLFFYTQRLRTLQKTLRGQGCASLRGADILEIGCGRGDWLVDFLRWGAEPPRLAGIDLDEARLASAKARLPQADLRVGDASNLPWSSDSFDLVLQSTVFTSILDPQMKQRVASEMLRVLRPHGLILWYDFRYNNPRNPNVRGIEAREIRALFPGCSVRLQKVTLAPPITRRLVRISWVLCLLLEKIPMLRTHYLGVIRKHAAQ